MQPMTTTTSWPPRPPAIETCKSGEVTGLTCYSDGVRWVHWTPRLTRQSVWLWVCDLCAKLEVNK